MFLNTIILNSTKNRNIQINNLTKTLFHTGTTNYAGHSKWQNIRHIKALMDTQRSDLFTKLSRQIRLAIVEGGGTDPKMNSQLTNIIEHALSKNMPKATVNKILMNYHVKAPMKQGVIELKMIKRNIFILLTVVTDNLSRTKGEVNYIVKKSKLVTFDMCKHMFREKGLITTKLIEGQTFAKVLKDAIEVGAEEVDLVADNEDYIQFQTNPLYLDSVKKSLDSKGYLIDHYEKVFSPLISAQLPASDKEEYEALKKKFLSVDGIEEVHDNIEIIENI
uniref:Putative transcriptional regulator n=1 Tax=Xenopsylla cheopis TaxID=163159 RepID=A0A6M2DYI2_XENCH